MSVEIAFRALESVEVSGSRLIVVHKLPGALFSAGISGLGEINHHPDAEALVTR